MKDDVRISYLGSVWYAVLTSEAEEMNSPVVSVLFRLCIPGHLSVALKNTPWLPIAFQTFSDFQILTLTSSRDHVPHPLSLVRTPGSRLLEQVASSASRPCWCSFLGLHLFPPPSLSA